MHKKNKKGFTLVEIMIVVVIIGLLAAMAIPAFQKVRESSITKTVENDGRQIGHAAQQYFMDTGATTVAISDLTGEGNYVTNLSRGVTTGGGSITTETSSKFTLLHDQIDTITFDNEGEVTEAD